MGKKNKKSLLDFGKKTKKRFKKLAFNPPSLTPQQIGMKHPDEVFKNWLRPVDPLSPIQIDGYNDFKLGDIKDPEIKNKVWELVLQDLEQKYQERLKASGYQDTD